ncbi:MAG: tol-pal system-associated acyl-CoA thioesterase [Gammaproteobacteria bacterium]|nr:tol-pal system-associated acyl-CoA thioesterase [Gammaproteobacteria bacterium]
MRVYYEDTDAVGIVYHANYLKFMERARTEWLRALGYEQDRLLAGARAFVVHRISVEYARPARFNDLLEVGVRVAALRRTGLTLAQDIRRAGGDALVHASVEVVCVDTRALSPRRIPEDIYAELSDAG